jgi:hypothetical protein
MLFLIVLPQEILIILGYYTLIYIFNYILHYFIIRYNNLE